MKRSAAWAIVRPVPGSQRKRIRSIFWSPSSSHSRGRWRRWSPGPKLVSGVRLSSSSPDEVGHPRDHPDPSLAGRRHQVASRVLLEQVVDGLDRGDPASVDRPQSLLAPADCGAERDTEVADLPLVAELLEGREAVVGVDRLHPRVVELIEVDAIGAEATQAGLERRANERAVPALGTLALGVLPAALGEHVAELGRQLHPVAVGSQHAPDQLLVGALTVGVSGLEEGDPELERLAQQPLTFGFGDLSPPGRAERPGAEADLRDFEVGVAETARPHAGGV